VCTSVWIAPVDGRTETVEGEEARMNGQILGPEGSLYVPRKGRGVAACKGRIYITASGYADSVFGTGGIGRICIAASGYVDLHFGDSAKYKYDKSQCQNAKRHNRKRLCRFVR
jgi:hypothetical protein